MTALQYMHIPLHRLPPDIIQQFNLRNFVTDIDSHVFTKINYGMCGLKQTSILAYNQLVKNLLPMGYNPIPNTVGM